jgi:hypothetical protein
VVVTGGGTSTSPAIQLGSTAEGLFYENSVGPAILAGSSKYIRFWQSGSPRWHFHPGTFNLENASGNGGTAIITYGAASGTLPAYTFTSDMDTGLGWNGNDDLRLVVGGVSSQSHTPTTMTSFVKRADTVQALVVADNGNGATRATSTLTPLTSYATINCSDAQGCDISISETGAVDGQILRIVCRSINVCGFIPSAGVVAMGATFDMGLNDSISFIYSVDIWIQLSRSDN